MLLSTIIDLRSKIKVKRGSKVIQTFFIRLGYVIALFFVAFDEYIKLGIVDLYYNTPLSLNASLLTACLSGHVERKDSSFLRY